MAQSARRPPSSSSLPASPSAQGVRAPAADEPLPGAGPFRIQAAADLSGVPAATLRAWERRYGIPAPRRTATSYRLYGADDVLRLRRMRELVASGVAPAEAARTILSSTLAIEPSAPVAAPEGDAMDLARKRLLAATQRYDARAIDEELTRLTMLLDAQTLYERVLSPVLVEVGKRWEDGVLSVAQEHLVSERIEMALRATLRALERTDGPLVLLGSVASDAHVFGLLGAALKLSLSGTRVVMLGANTPPSAVADAVRSMAPRLVGLSATLEPPTPRALFKAYGKACGATPWVVGGAGAERVRAAIEDAGGIAAVGATNAWQSSIREWIRGNP